MKPVELEVANLRKSFGERLVLKNVELKVHAHEVLALIGPSGSGKSTLLRCLNLLEIPDQADFVWEGEPIPWKTMPESGRNAHRQKMGMVFQHFHLFPHLNVIENILEGPVQVLGEPVKTATERAMQLLKRVGLEDRAHCKPHELSGGQKQRIAIARALNMQPRMLLLDEPTSALDIEMIAGINDLMAELALDGMTMVLVTHDLAFARDVAHRICFLEDGEILEDGPSKEVLTSPRSERFRLFLSQCRFL